MTSADDHCVIAIARACSKFQYLNLGSCNKISNYDEVCMSIWCYFEYKHLGNEQEQYCSNIEFYDTKLIRWNC